MGQILSHSEIEAILTGLNLEAGIGAGQKPIESAADPKTAAHEVTAYDFEHPIPLRPLELDRLRLASAAVTQGLQARLTDLFRISVSANFLGVEQSTYHDYLSTAEKPACIAVYGSTNPAGTWLLDIHRSLAFTMIDCLLGGSPSENSSIPAITRPFTDLETRFIDKSIRAILSELTACLFHPISLSFVRVVSDGSLLAEASSNEAVALVSYEIIVGGGRGLLQLCVPWVHVTQNSRSNPVDGDRLQALMRSGASKLPVTATVRVARVKLSTRDLSGLTPGDVLLTDASAEGEMSLEVGGREIFRGTPGQIEDRRVLRLTAQASTLPLNGAGEE